MPEPEATSSLLKARDLFLKALLEGDRKAAVDVALGAVEAGAAVSDFYVDVVQEALYEVGRLWEANVISVSREHLATSISQFVIGRLYEHLPQATFVRGRFLLTGIEGELHQVGGLMVADLLESDGWVVKFLGTDVPVPDVLEAVEEHRPDVLGISCTMLHNVQKVASLVASVRERFGDRSPRIVVGGGAFRSAPERAAKLGADGWAPDLRAAVVLLHGGAQGDQR